MTVGAEDIHRALGELAAKVELLLDNQRQSDKEARESRHRVANAAMVTAGQILDLQHELKAVVAQLEAVKRDVDALKPFAEKAREWEARGKGALAAAGMIGGGIGGALIYYKERIFDYFN